MLRPEHNRIQSETLPNAVKREKKSKKRGLLEIEKMVKNEPKTLSRSTVSESASLEAIVSTFVYACECVHVNVCVFCACVFACGGDGDALHACHGLLGNMGPALHVMGCAAASAEVVVAATARSPMEPT